jgi:hypothetical protein
MDDKISWLGGWASQWRPPQIQDSEEQMDRIVPCFRDRQSISLQFMRKRIEL